MNILELLGISYLNLYIWMLFGSVIGIIAHLHDHRQARGGVIITMLIAIVGSVTGGYLANLFLAKTMIDFSLEGFATAMMTAFMLAVLYRISFRNNGYIRLLK
jgi:uncharacterized membrane protein YeaQ/YmgE (transglycosylase-associated protein family)